MGRRRERRNRQEDVGGMPRWTTIAKKLKNYGLMLLLFETPSGFALFTFSEVYFHLPNTLRDIWAKFADPHRASCVVTPMEFDTFEDKSSAINADTGVNKRLADMIYKWRLPGMKLAVGKCNAQQGLAPLGREAMVEGAGCGRQWRRRGGD